MHEISEICKAELSGDHWKAAYFRMENYLESMWSKTREDAKTEPFFKGSNVAFQMALAAMGRYAEDIQDEPEPEAH